MANMNDRELDALVAEKVMGCKVLWQMATVKGPYCGCNCNDGFEIGPHSDPNKFDENLYSYSTDIAAAWQVVEKIKETRGTHSTFKLQFVDTKWFCYWDHEDFLDGSDKYPSDCTAPRAICLAALKAVGVEITS